MDQREVFKNNVALFTQGFVERNWDALQQQPADVATTVVVELSSAAIEAAQYEADNYGVAAYNVEAMFAKGQEWMPSVSIL